MGDDLRVAMGDMLAAFGVPATVTRPAPEDTPIETEGIWFDQDPEVPVGAEFRRRELRRVLALDKAAVPTAPRGTVILAPETLGGDVLTWQVEGPANLDRDAIEVIVVRVETS